MKILSIETSCDETGISIIECTGGIKNPSFKVLANALSSQVKIHAEYGGVFPALAKREHIKNLPILLEKILKKTKLKKTDVITVTYGPGLEPALWTGIVFAKELAKKWNVPLVPVNHMEGHILSVFGKEKGKFTIPKTKFPVLSLLVSGGHTELVLAKEWMQYKVIGETVDDASGEAFDKVARMLGLPYPGGPEISKLAESERNNKSAFRNPLASSQREARLSSKIFSKRDQAKFSAAGFEKQFIISLPRPMMYSKNFNFSFSGLKTAVLYLIRDLTKENPNILNDEKIKSAIALEFENAVVDTLVYKTKKAIDKYGAKTLIVAGGVASNKHLRNEIKKTFSKNVQILFPDKKLSTDNSIMIGIVGYLQFIKKKGKFGNGSKIKANGNLHL
jgi:N6-L-threonylcarbamoyladenine synthase